MREPSFCILFSALSFYPKTEKMRQVTINGKQYDVKFTMRTAINYERRTGKKLQEFINAQSQEEVDVLSIIDMIDLMLEYSGAPLASDLESMEEFNEVVAQCSLAISDYFKPQKGDDLNTTVPDESSSASGSPN